MCCVVAREQRRTHVLWGSFSPHQSCSLSWGSSLVAHEKHREHTVFLKSDVGRGYFWRLRPHQISESLSYFLLSVCVLLVRIFFPPSQVLSDLSPHHAFSFLRISVPLLACHSLCQRLKFSASVPSFSHPVSGVQDCPLLWRLVTASLSRFNACPKWTGPSAVVGEPCRPFPPLLPLLSLPWPELLSPPHPPILRFTVQSLPCQPIQPSLGAMSLPFDWNTPSQMFFMVANTITTCFHVQINF